MTKSIAMVGSLPDRVREALEQDFTIHRVDQVHDKLGTLEPIADQVNVVTTNAMAGVSADVIDALPNLELIAIMGVGLERTDIKRAKERGITVTTTPVLYDDVADLGIILAMNACRRIVQADQFVRSGQWLKGRYSPAMKFSGKRAGILGLGRIGKALAKRLEAFGMTISYYDPRPVEGVTYRSYPSEKALAADSDILFLAASGGQEGGHIVTAEVLNALGPKGVFINVARGWLVDEPVLVDALENGGIGAAGLDVFDDEPTVPSALLQLDNVVLTPHIASNTEETVKAMGDCVLDNIRSWMTGKGAVTPID
ncbi:MAG: 2-hydroxyacid dehydrogenase [Geminicoccaceae bacterium]